MKHRILLISILAMLLQISLQQLEPPTYCNNNTNLCTGEIIPTMEYIPFEDDLKNMITLKQTYSVYEQLFTREDQMGLYNDMQWIEENYADQFMDSHIKRNYGDYADGDYVNYHRISKVYWLTFIKQEDYKHLPYTVKFKQWISLLKHSINKNLPEGWEVAQIEEQYIYYEYGGKFEAHFDTHCNPFECEKKEHHYPRLLTFIIYLNPDWNPEDEGNYCIHQDGKQQCIQPTMGKAAIFRGDKVLHSAEFVYRVKRAISLFINIKNTNEVITQ